MTAQGALPAPEAVSRGLSSDPLSALCPSLAGSHPSCQALTAPDKTRQLRPVLCSVSIY